jgi:hypothetical protein
MEGCINYLFPFSFREHPTAVEVRKNPRRISDPAVYQKVLENAVAQLQSLGKSIRWGITWIPRGGWEFNPFGFSSRNGLESLLPALNQNGKNSTNRLSPDQLALIAGDGFFFLSEYLRRQPLVRIRLSDTARITLPPENDPVVPSVAIDLTLHLSLGQGCLVFRHLLQNMTVDQIIGMRLAQFRRGMSYRWEYEKDAPGSSPELQDAYHRIGTNWFGKYFTPTYDVRQFAAVVEIRGVKTAGGARLNQEKIVSANPSWLYGLLHVDERWRDVDPRKAEEGLSLTAPHTGWYRIYAQAVSLLVLHAIRSPKMSSSPPNGNVLDRYYWNLRRNLDRTVADRCCELEALMAQENLMCSLYEEYRRRISASAPPRGRVQNLRKELVVSCQEADESFNIIPGEEILLKARGLANWKDRISSVLQILETILSDYRLYNTEFFSDLGTAIGVGFSVTSILYALRWEILLCAQCGVTAGGGFLALVRFIKYKDRNTFLLVAGWLFLVLFIWVL